MLFYWAMYLIPAFISLGEQTRRGQRAHYLPLTVLFVALFVIIAFRETGGDYEEYLNLYNLLVGVDLKVAITSTDPIYGFLNWLSAQLGLGLYGVNALCALVFLSSLYRFSQKEPLPFFLATMAIPYFVIVGGMGYVRQGVAAALLMPAILELRRGRLIGFLIYITLAAGFHRSAFVFAALPIFVKSYGQENRISFLVRVALIAVAIIGFWGLSGDQIGVYDEYYIKQDRYVSSGALLRSLVHGAAGVAYFWSARTWRKQFDDFSIWLPFALLALLSVPLSLVWSTPVDRIALYLFPFQLVTFARIPYLRGTNSGTFQSLKVGLLLGYTLYFYVWLHHGQWAQELWIPYRCLFTHTIRL